MILWWTEHLYTAAVLPVLLNRWTQIFILVRCSVSLGLEFCFSSRKSRLELEVAESQDCGVSTSCNAYLLWLLCEFCSHPVKEQLFPTFRKPSRWQHCSHGSGMLVDIFHLHSHIPYCLFMTRFRCIRSMKAPCRCELFAERTVWENQLELGSHFCYNTV